MKAPRNKPKHSPVADLFPYRTEDLEPRNMREEIASEDAFVERNRDTINEALAEGYRDIERGDVRTLEDVEADLKRRRKARGIKHCVR